MKAPSNMPLYKFAKFLAVGLSNTAISYVAFLSLLYLFSIAALAQALAYACGVIWSYYFNSRWTFKKGGSGLFLRFIGLQMSLLVISSLSLGMLVDGYGFDANICWLGVMGALTLVNFLCSQRWVFVEIKP